MAPGGARASACWCSSGCRTPSGDGHPVLAVVRGSAVNQDGASNGLTAPNGPRRSGSSARRWPRAGLAPSEVDAVEGHGTGTLLGDPIEAQALLATYGQERDGRPLWLGSVKSNIGHTQAAAGVAGIIKMVMALRTGMLPTTLHVDKPSPHVDWPRQRPPAHRGSAMAGNGPRRAGVSSFGISGTNAHVIVEEAPAAADEASGASTERRRRSGGPPEPAVAPWLLSARSPGGPARAGGRGRGPLAAQPRGPADIEPRARQPWSTLEHRAVIIAAEQEAFLAALDGWHGASPAPIGPRRRRARARPHSCSPAREASSQAWAGSSTRRSRCSRVPWTRPASTSTGAPGPAAARRHVRGRRGPRRLVLHQTSFTQAALFALEVALFRLVESWGVASDFVAGHSIGELAACDVAGVLALPDACALVAARGGLIEALPGGGAMMAIQAAEREIAAMLGREQEVALAALNGPASLVISGPRQRSWRSPDHLGEAGRTDPCG